MKTSCDCCGREFNRIKGEFKGRRAGYCAPWGGIDLCHDCADAYYYRRPQSMADLRRGRVGKWGAK